MFEINVGTYITPDSGIHYKILKPIRPYSDKHLWLVVSQNGIEKTSFMEGIILKKLRAENIPFFFIGQDFHVQSLALRSTIAVLDFKSCKGSEYKLVEYVLSKIQEQSILILDEFDKRCTENEFLNLISYEKSSHVFVVSHREEWLKNKRYGNL